MGEKSRSSLQQIREERGFSRKELSERSGVNFRSLQDYEQGHKSIGSAKAETLYRLSIALGCTIEELLELPMEGLDTQKLLEEKKKKRDRIWLYSCLLAKRRQEILDNIRICSSEYHVFGRLEIKADVCHLIFSYDGKVITLPFRAKITEETFPWLADIAVIMMDTHIRNYEFKKSYQTDGGNAEDET